MKWLLQLTQNTALVVMRGYSGCQRAMEYAFSTFKGWGEPSKSNDERNVIDAKEDRYTYTSFF